MRDYGHLFDEFDPAKREPAEAAPRVQVRTSLVPFEKRDPRKAARRAENPYSGISHSGNHRDTSSSNGSSCPTWDFRRSSRSLSRACSPFAGTNG
jgi:hypothetical protein